MSNKDTIRKLVNDYLNAGDEQVAEQTWSTDYRWRRGSGNADSKDRRTHKAERLDLVQMFPDFTKRIDAIIEEGDLVATICTQGGTHGGAMRTPGGGEIPPTGNRVEWVTISMHRFADGVVAEGWIVWDFVEILKQVGVLSDWRDPLHRALSGPRQGRHAGRLGGRINQKQLARRAVTAHLLSKDAAGDAGLFHPEYRNPRGFRDEGDAPRLTDVFDDLDVEIQAQVSEGDLVITRSQLRGRQVRRMPTPFGPADPTDARADWMVMTGHRFRDGQIVQDWLVHDPLRMLQQLGHAPAWAPGAV